MYVRVVLALTSVCDFYVGCRHRGFAVRDGTSPLTPPRHAQKRDTATETRTDTTMRMCLDRTSTFLVLFPLISLASSLITSDIYTPPS